MRTRGELRLIERAIREGWDIPEAGRRNALKTVLGVLESSESTDRELFRACRVAILMEGANQNDELDSELYQRVKEHGIRIERELKCRNIT